MQEYQAASRKAGARNQLGVGNLRAQDRWPNSTRCVGPKRAEVAGSTAAKRSFDDVPTRRLTFRNRGASHTGK
jgi:hypothetical protein